MEPDKVSGFVFDSEKYTNLSLEEKRVLVHEIVLWADNAPEVLQSWTRRELLQIICAETGKEVKYTGLPKSRMIARLLKLVSARSNNCFLNNSPNNSTVMMDDENSYTKRRKKETQLTSSASQQDGALTDLNSALTDLNSALTCQNLACQANLLPGEAFCRRCSCCICYHYDENKDPSLWLVCNSDLPYNSESCGMTCHLSCLLKHQKADFARNGDQILLDACYYCVSCGKVNGLIGSWRKQLVIARDARRVDVLCYRISLSHNILRCSERYKELHSIVNEAAKKLQTEVGPLDKVSTEMARGIVNRLSCGAEVQKLCSDALEGLDSLLSGAHVPSCDAIADLQGFPICRIQFENLSSTSVSLSFEPIEKSCWADIRGYKLWHRSSDESVYPPEPTCTIGRSENGTVVSGLAPSTEYHFKVSLFSSSRALGSCEARWVTDMPDGSAIKMGFCRFDNVSAQKRLFLAHSDGSGVSPQRASTNSSENCLVSKAHKMDGSRSRSPCLEDIRDIGEKVTCPSECVPFVCSNSDHPDTPTKPEHLHGTPDPNEKGPVERDYAYCVKAIRWLECEGHMEKDFRVKLLTWFSLKATKQERRVVKTFIDVLIDEPESLVDQLIDSFMDGICNKEKQAFPTGIWTRMWH